MKRIDRSPARPTAPLLALHLLAVLALPHPAAGQASGGLPAADELLTRSIAHHDPGGRWAEGAFRLTLRESRPDGPDRATELAIDNAAGTFELRREVEGRVMEGRTGYGPDAECSWTLDGSSEIPDAAREEHGLTCERLTLLRDYYTYLWGLPMKLRDPGTRLGAVTAETVDGRRVLRLRVTYDEDVGGDVWDFDFDPDTAALVRYRFFHDEAAGDGEHIELDGATDGAGLRLPRERAWYTNQGREHLGTDTLLRIAPLDEKGPARR